MSIKIMTIEKERDHLKWNQDKLELQNRVNEQKDLIKAKESEYKNKEDKLNLRLKEEI
jgi:hypothetical protein